MRAGTQPTETTAKLVTGAELDQIREKIVAKYGFMTKLTELLATIGGPVKRKRSPMATAASPSPYRNPEPSRNPERTRTNGPTKTTSTTPTHRRSRTDR